MFEWCSRPICIAMCVCVSLYLSLCLSLSIRAQKAETPPLDFTEQRLTCAHARTHTASTATHTVDKCNVA